MTTIGMKKGGLATLLLSSTMLVQSPVWAQVQAPPQAAEAAVKKHQQKHAPVAVIGGPGAAPAGGAPLKDKHGEKLGATIEGEGDEAKVGTSKRAIAQSKSTIGSEAIQNSGAQNTYDAIKNVPGVTQSDAKGGSVADNVQIRGIHLSSTTGYRLDGGLPIVNNLIMPIEDKERIETLKGASALVFGLASPAGVINYIMKRATDTPSISFGVAANDYGQALGTLDMGGRFGFDHQFGLRVIFSGGGTENGVHNTEGTKGLGAIAFDWRPNDRFTLKVDFEEFGVSAIEQGTLLQNKPVNGRVTLPSVPNYYQLNSGPWAKYKGVGQNVFVSGTYKLDYGFEVVSEVGRSEARKLERNLGQIGNYNVATGMGTETVTLIDNQDYVNTYLKGELRHHFKYSFVTNDLILGINRNERDFNGPANGSFSFAQNIYSPIQGPTPPSPQPGVYSPNNDNDIGYYASEDVGIFNRIHLLGGVREVVFHGYAVSTTTGRLNTSQFNFTAPSFGVVVDVLPGIQLYASYVEALQETGEAPQSAINAFQVLPPAQANQKEVGIRATKIYNASATFAAFDLQQANAIIDSVTNIYGINGTQEIRGLEGTFRYDILPQFINLTFVSGGQLSYSVQHSSDPTINNMESENSPRVSGNAGLIYRPGFIKGLTLNGGALFTGSRELTNQEQGKIPAVTVFNIGANYATTFNGHRMTYNISCSNLLDKSYFSSAVNGALGVGRPRTIFVGSRIEF